MTLPAIVRTVRRLVGRWIPAAADNQRGNDVESLIACRRIGRLPVADPDDARRANDYLHQTGDETP